MPRVRLYRSAVALAFLAVASGRAQTALPKESPFMPAPGSAVAAAPTNETLELGGFSGTGQTTVVCITDIQAKRSHWIPVGSTTEGIKVLSFDAAKDQATITVGGQQKTLRMRKSTVAAAGTAAAGFATAAPAAVTPTQGVPQPPPAPGSIAQQETEARMLVSDLLEIGIQQRKAYEEAQKKADQEKAAAKEKKN